MLAAARIRKLTTDFAPRAAMLVETISAIGATVTGAIRQAAEATGAGLLTVSAWDEL